MDQEEIIRFTAKVETLLGNIEEKVDGVNSRLDALNGKVAKHEEKLNEIALDKARRDGAAEANNSWLHRIGPIGKFVGALLIVELLKNGPQILALLHQGK